jgi:hypothetical protein
MCITNLYIFSHTKYVSNLFVEISSNHHEQTDKLMTIQLAMDPIKLYLKDISLNILTENSM